MAHKKLIIGLGVVAVLAGGAVYLAWKASATNLPAPQPVTRVVNLPQGWSDEERQRYHYTAQGTLLLPASWLGAMEQGFFSDRKLTDPEMLAGLRFLTDGVQTDDWNKAGLPIGWTTATWAAPSGGPALAKVGFNCATCHTGQINYRGTAIRIEGGGAMADSAQFQKIVGTSVVATYLLPWKRARFLDAVTQTSGLPREVSAEMLRGAFWTAVDAAWVQFRMSLYPGEGFGRLDALQRIANTLLADDLHVPSNNRPATAPVKFPFLWDIWRFDWVQYNASVRQPMARNVGEALGVRAEVNFVTNDGTPVPEAERWKTSIPVQNLQWMEDTLHRLRPPAWPADILPPLDPAKQARGREVFAQRCAGCHGIQVDRTRVPEEWKLPMIPLAEVGTAPGEAMNFITLRYDASKLGASAEIDGKTALATVTKAVATTAYDALGYTQEQRAAADGFGREDSVIANPVYKARPLVGIWATPPYLHNGSVPTLYDLLSPTRPASFFIGSREYDPVKVGFETKDFAGAQVLDTTVPGNENTGHWFADDARPGKLGPALSEDDRWALIEYLKGATNADYPCRDAATKEPLSGAVCDSE